MGTIFYSINGDGRGHATRVKTLVSQLDDQHKFHLLTSGDAFDFLVQAFDGNSRVTVHQIEGLRFRYKRGKVNYVRCLGASLPFALQMGKYVKRIQALMVEHRCDAAISDFEPLLPRAAAKSNIPLLSIDHQTWLTISDFSDLPRFLRWKTWFIGLSLPLFYKGKQDYSIVSSFYHPPIKPNIQNALQVGVLLRDEILHASPIHGEHLLVYLRRHESPSLTEALKNCGRPVRVYGLGVRPNDGNIQYLEVDEQGFLRDLIGCHALISNAGNQLMGEAAYLQKPILALPETGNFEQMLNAHYVEKAGFGLQNDFSSIGRSELKQFLDQVEELRLHCVPEEACGNEKVLRALHRFLQKHNVRSDLTGRPVDVGSKSSFDHEYEGIPQTSKRAKNEAMTELLPITSNHR